MRRRWSGSRSGYSTFSDRPRSPPKPPSPLAKIDDRAVHSVWPASSVVTDSWTMTAAEPLSWTSTIRVRVVAFPAGGSGRCAVTFWLPWTTFARSMSTPGKDTFGGSVVWKPAATVANVGNTLGAESWTYASDSVFIGSVAAPTAR